MKLLQTKCCVVQTTEDLVTQEQKGKKKEAVSVFGGEKKHHSLK